MHKFYDNSSMDSDSLECSKTLRPLLDGMFLKLYEGELKIICEKESSTICDQLTSHASLKYKMGRIRNLLQKEAQEYQILWTPGGRIGPDVTDFNKRTCIGNFQYKDNPIELTSKDKFSTVIANTCVYKGKWQYEVLLGTKGVMQIGWATLQCKFSQEQGVGDTPDSYAYDGSGKRKWNVSACKYGETWNCGDVISCTIDADKGEVAYFRNGRSLGISFDNIKIGPGIAYFPAMSLALDENVIVNFGAASFFHPQCGFHPLQAPPAQSIYIAGSSFGSLLRLVDISLNWSEDPNLVRLEAASEGKRQTCLLTLAQYIGYTLSPLLTLPYVIEEVFINMLFQFLNLNLDKFDAPSHPEKAHVLFNFLFAIFEEEEMKRFMEQLIMSLQRCHRQVSQDIKFVNQNKSLQLLHVILSHGRLRKFCITHILFVRLRFSSFVCLKSIDLEEMKNMFAEDFWSNRDGSFRRGSADYYMHIVRKINEAIIDLEKLQIEILQLLMICDDGPFGESSRAIFLSKLRLFIKDQPTGSRLQVPPVVMFYLFQRLLNVFCSLWETEVKDELGGNTVSPTLFYEGSLQYFDIHRLGGLYSHLKKTYSYQRDVALKSAKENKVILDTDEPSQDLMEVGPVMKHPSTSSDDSVGEAIISNIESIEDPSVIHPVTLNADLNLEKVPPRDEQQKIRLRTSLLHLLDGIIMLYHIGGHKYIEKVHGQNELMFGNVNHLQDLVNRKETSIQKGCPDNIIKEFDFSILVLEKRLREQMYHTAWNAATIFNSNGNSQLLLLLKFVLGALNNSSSEGQLFAFVPDFYIETLSELCQDLRNLFICNAQVSKQTNEEELNIYQVGGWNVSPDFVKEYKTLLREVGEFLASHFCDARIVYADSKDSLIQVLAGFVCYRPGLCALEGMKKEIRLQMVCSLLQPYENRAWAQNNWILVRFWKEKGFGFRFTKSPHLVNILGPKPAYCESTNIMESSSPCPSDVFLNHVSELLEGSSDISTPFLNSLLNQFNWAFSEFIGMLQEIQNASNRPERVFIDSRQLRICATCFDLALALLRVLEMIVNTSPCLFMDTKRSNALSLLKRLCQLLCQVLNRVSVIAGCFCHVVNLEIPGLESIHYYPILTAVTGIMCCLLKNDIYRTEADPYSLSATKTLLDEPSFQLASMYALIGGKDALEPRKACNKDSPEVSNSSSKDASPSALSELASQANSSSDACPDDLRGYFKSPKCDCKLPRFCLRKYTQDVSPQEIRKVIDVIYHLEDTMSLLPEPNHPEDACTICYASLPSAKFSPCQHSSCVTCITHYLMNRSECFFCKTTIEQVTEITTGRVIYKSSGNHNS